MNEVSLLWNRGADGAEAFGGRPAAYNFTATHLKDDLTKPATWGPSEWGPIPYLPSPDVLVSRMERQWGSLSDYRGISSTAKGKQFFYLAAIHSKLTVNCVQLMRVEMKCLSRAKETILGLIICHTSIILVCSTTWVWPMHFCPK